MRSDRALLCVLLLTSACKGSTGDTGPEGAIGPAGPQGPKGDPATTGAGADGGAIAGYSPYGNGSAGELHDTSGTPAVLDGTNFQYTDFTIDAGVSMNMPGGVVIRCTGTFTLNGSIFVIPAALSGTMGINGLASQVYPELLVPEAGVGGLPTFADFATSAVTVGGGVGGKGLSSGLGKGLLMPTRGGGGGIGTTANNQSGGGYLVIVADKGIVLGPAATITAKGSSSGGGGGVVILASATSVTIPAGAVVTVAGGPGDQSDTAHGAEGGGGGGIIHTIAPTLTIAGTLDVAGGAGGAVTAAVTNSPRSGGSGGGASGGSGGNGGAVMTNNTATAPTAGSPGYALQDTFDPTDLL